MYLEMWLVFVGRGMVIIVVDLLMFVVVYEILDEKKYGDLEKVLYFLRWIDYI